MKLNGATYNFSFMGLNGVSVLRFSIAVISVKSFFTNKTIQASGNASYNKEGAVSKGAAFSN